MILPVPRVAWHRKLRSRSPEFGTGLEGIPDGPSEYATECTRKGSRTSKRTWKEHFTKSSHVQVDFLFYHDYVGKIERTYLPK